MLYTSRRVDDSHGHVKQNDHRAEYKRIGYAILWIAAEYYQNVDQIHDHIRDLTHCAHSKHEIVCVSGVGALVRV